MDTQENLLELLKEALRSENNGIHSARVEECTHFTAQVLPLDSIALGNLSHFERVQPREPYSPNGGAVITGIVVKSSETYRIVDGYHRLKYSLEQGTDFGMFIVISMNPI